MKEHPLISAIKEMGVTPHTHKFGDRDEAYEPFPTWLLRRPRFYFQSCCGVKERRMTMRYTKTCEVCGIKETHTYGIYGFCEVCGGIRDYTGYY